MRRTITTVGALAVLAFPAAAPAGESGKKDRQNAARECRAERGTTDASIEAFRVKYGKNANGRNAFGRCVREKAREERTERRQARRAAAQACREERGTTDASVQAFRQKYGKENGGKAMRRCLAQKTQAGEKAADTEDRDEAAEITNAAQACDEERGATEASRAAFVAKYGTKENGRNAFGKCVAAAVQADEDEDDDDDDDDDDEDERS